MKDPATTRVDEFPAPAPVASYGSYYDVCYVCDYVSY